MAAIELDLSRRGFLAGLGAAMAAPAIVKASALMPLRGEVIASSAWSGQFLALALKRHGRVRFVERINVDGLTSENPPDLFELMRQAVNNQPGAVRNVGGFVVRNRDYAFVSDPMTGMYMDVQAIRDSNVAMRPHPLVARATHLRQFRGFPIETLG